MTIGLSNLESHMVGSNLKLDANARSNRLDNDIMAPKYASDAYLDAHKCVCG
jgi:hypothetical protein